MLCEGGSVHLPFVSSDGIWILCLIGDRMYLCADWSVLQIVWGKLDGDR